MSTTRSSVRGRDLKVGDMMRFLGDWHRVVSLAPYVGTLAYLWNGEARIARWENGSGMTIGPNDWIEVA